MSVHLSVCPSICPLPNTCVERYGLLTECLFAKEIFADEINAYSYDKESLVLVNNCGKIVITGR